MEFEKKYSKQQILEMYFNEIYYGNGAWGIAQAARLYFDKNPEELTEAECSLLAGVQKNPGRYNPLGKSADVSLRRDVVLKRMVDLEMISSRQQQQLRAHPPAIMQPGQASQYLAHIRSKLVERYGAGVIEQGGLEVTSAMDLTLQNLAEKILAEGVKKIAPKLQGALVCLDPLTGDLLAAVGGVEAVKNDYNRAFYAKRQPGSAIKPIIYATALEKGISAGSIWNDTPASYSRGDGQEWRPQNYDGKTHGDLSLRQALSTSNNVIAVKLLENVGTATFADVALKLGLTLRARDLSLALGTEEVTLGELVTAYAPLANGGSRPEPRTIIRVYDRNRRSWTENPPALTPVLPPAIAYITTQMMKDVLTTGTARSLKKFSQERPAAGKTGTTNDYRDAWFVGYTPQMVTGIWVGYDKPKPGGKGFTGGAVAAPIWGRFMRQALAGKPVMDFTKPDEVTIRSIDPTTGFLATAACPEKRDEFYIIGTEPTEYCLKHGAAPQQEPAVETGGAEPPNGLIEKNPVQPDNDKSIP
jgi:membrane carboxypeptidase/penicillin-binding protein